MSAGQLSTAAALASAIKLQCPEVMTSSCRVASWPRVCRTLMVEALADEAVPLQPLSSPTTITVVVVTGVTAVAEDGSLLPPHTWYVLVVAVVADPTVAVAVVVPSNLAFIGVAGGCSPHATRCTAGVYTTADVPHLPFHTESMAATDLSCVAGEAVVNRAFHKLEEVFLRYKARFPTWFTLGAGSDSAGSGAADGSDGAPADTDDRQVHDTCAHTHTHSHTLTHTHTRSCTHK